MSTTGRRIADLIIIGGGASGMSCAIAYTKSRRREGKSSDVLILEKNDRVGKKVLATGNGRCNLGNQDMQESHFHSRREDFPKQVLAQVPQKETLSFLSEIGIITATEGNKYFPLSKSSSSVVDAFRFALAEYGIEVIPDTEVTEIRKDEIFHVSSQNGVEYAAKRVVIACGGACAPALGTTGDGYRWLRQLGHKVYAPKPSIVQLVTENSVTKPLAGLKLEAELTLVSDDMVIAQQYGEVLFAAYGLSGPAVFQVSGEVSRRVRKGNLTVPVKVSLRLFDEADLLAISEELSRRRETMAGRPVDQLLLSILPGRIAAMLLKSALDRPLSVMISSLSDKDIARIVATMRAWDFAVLGTQGLENAQTTIGGADCEEFAPETMESLLVPGLYCCGEVLDVDGDCGGDNLQWAFSSGILAGRSASEASLREGES